MKIEINVKKKHLYILSALIAVFAIGLLVVAAGNPAVFGHTKDDLDLRPITFPANKVKIDTGLEVVGHLDTRSITIRNPFDLIVWDDIIADYNSYGECNWINCKSLGQECLCGNGRFMAGVKHFGGRAQGDDLHVYCCEI